MTATLEHPTELQNSYPIQLLIRGRSALVVGGGKVALRKIKGLIRAGAEVTVVAPWIHPEVATLAIDIVQRPYKLGEAGDYQLVITCTDDPHVNRQVFRDAEAEGVWVNSADDPVNCSFILPAVARQGDLTLTVSTNGKSPAMAMWLRRKFQAEFDERYAKLLDLLAEVRAEARYVLGTSEIGGWNEALDDNLFELVAAGDIDQARSKLRTSVGLDVDPLSTSPDAPKPKCPLLGGAEGRGAQLAKPGETSVDGAEGRGDQTDNQVLRANARAQLAKPGETV